MSISPETSVIITVKEINSLHEHMVLDQPVDSRIFNAILGIANELLPHGPYDGVSTTIGIKEVVYPKNAFRVVPLASLSVLAQ